MEVQRQLAKDGVVTLTDCEVYCFHPPKDRRISFVDVRDA
jgi:hypothetical protein